MPEAKSKHIFDILRVEDKEAYTNRKSAVVKKGVSVRIENFYQLKNDGQKKKEVEKALFDDSKSSNKKRKPFKFYKLALREYPVGLDKSSKFIDALSNLGPNIVFES